MCDSAPLNVTSNVNIMLLMSSQRKSHGNLACAGIIERPTTAWTEKAPFFMMITASMFHWMCLLFCFDSRIIKVISSGGLLIEIRLERLYGLGCVFVSLIFIRTPFNIHWGVSLPALNPKRLVWHYFLWFALIVS